MSHKMHARSLADILILSRVTLALSLIMGLSASASAARLSVLHHFREFEHASSGLLAQGRDGNLYGTGGGQNGSDGVAFKLTPTGRFTVLHEFASTKDGHYPRSGLTLGGDGNFYGAAQWGGIYGLGTVFRMTPAGAIKVLHHFGSAKPDGCYPFAPPIQGRDGNLYGTTPRCGEDNAGTVYKITAAGTFSVLYSFDWFTRGSMPEAPLIQGTDGVLYGTALYGGSARNSGTVFKVTTSGVASTLYRFDGTHGKPTSGPLVQGTDGDLYGTTAYDDSLDSGGTVFKLTLGGAIRILHRFDGYPPYAGLVQGSDGSFYGASAQDPFTTRSASALFRITSAGDYSVQARFYPYTTGAVPLSTPFLHTNGRIYGLTFIGGAYNWGTVYSLSVGAPSFIKAIPDAAQAGSSVFLLGGTRDTTAVDFNRVNAVFSGTGSTYRAAIVPAGAATGLIKVSTPAGTIQTLKPFLQLPTLSGFGPTSGAVGSSVVLTGTGLLQTTTVAFGGHRVASFIVNNARRISTIVPIGATMGKIAVTTKGGVVSTATAFKVVP